MDKNDFYELKKFKREFVNEDGKVEEVLLNEFASWAIWDEHDREDMAHIEDEKNLKELRPNIVFVGLNPSKNIEDIRGGWEPWQNFYRMGRLYDLLSSTRFRGAYMTDLIKKHYDTKGVNVKKYFNKNPEKIKFHLDFFFTELDMLKTKIEEMYLLGDKLGELFKEYIINVPERFFLILQKVIKCQKICHYKWQKSDSEFLERARVQLGLAEPKDDEEKKKLIHILWNNE
jgi:hypothetical protein